MVPLQVFKLPIPWVLAHLHTITDAVFRSLCRYQCGWMVLFLFSQVDINCMISKNNLKCGLQIFISPSQVYPSPVSRCWCGFCLKMQCVYWQCFSKVFLNPCSDIINTIMLFFNWILPEGLKAFNVGFRCVLCVQRFFLTLWIFYLDYGWSGLGHIKPRSNLRVARI